MCNGNVEKAACVNENMMKSSRPDSKVQAQNSKIDSSVFSLSLSFVLIWNVYKVLIWSNKSKVMQTHYDFHSNCSESFIVWTGTFQYFSVKFEKENK